MIWDVVQTGWVVFSPEPWRVMGPYASFEEAARVAGNGGLDFRICFGVRREGHNDFSPWPEPDGRDQDDCGSRTDKRQSKGARPRRHRARRH
jgi:hypothetical protein